MYIVSSWLKEEHKNLVPSSRGGDKFSGTLDRRGGTQPWLGISKPDHKLFCLASLNGNSVSDLPEPVTLQRPQWPLAQIAGAKARVTMTWMIRRAGVENGGGFAGKLYP